MVKFWKNYLKLNKEEKEIKRIASLVRFFELDRCLSANLARYFDDQQAPENCGHCSVCRGKSVKLSYSPEYQQALTQEAKQQLNEATLLHVLTEFKEHMNKHSVKPNMLTIETYCRFLAGLSVPIFSRNKVKKLSGFGLCEQLRYQEIRAIVAVIHAKLH